MVDQRELHLFRLLKYDQQTHEYWDQLSLLVHREPFQVYQHHLKGNELTLIYEKEVN